jgi:hypothetical protein
MVSSSPNRLVASFTEAGGHIRLSANIEDNKVIFPGREAPTTVLLSDEEARDIRQALVRLKDLEPKTEWPHPTPGRDMSMLMLKVTQPPTLAMDIRGSYHSPETPQDLHNIRAIIGQARRRLPRP